MSSYDKKYQHDLDMRQAFYTQHMDPDIAEDFEIEIEDGDDEDDEEKGPAQAC